jgi:hypothetical protein
MAAGRHGSRIRFGPTLLSIASLICAHGSASDAQVNSTCPRARLQDDTRFVARQSAAELHTFRITALRCSPRLVVLCPKVAPMSDVIDLTAVSSPMERHGQALVAGGFNILPIAPREKFPARHTGQGYVMLSWERYRADPAIASTVRMWGMWPECGVGIICGKVVAVDIDIEDEALVQRVYGIINKHLGVTPAVRIGREPRKLLVYRTETPFRKLRRGPVEVLGDGQQFVAYGIHPAGHEYRWPGEALHELRLADLPEVTEERVIAALDEVWEILPAPMKASLKAKAPTAQEEWARRDGSILGQAGNPDAIENALLAIPNDDLHWEDWNKIGMALYGALADDGLPLFDNWSRLSNKYGGKGDSPARRWAAYRRSPPAQLGAGTIYHIAQSYGWRCPTEMTLAPTPEGEQPDLSGLLALGSSTNAPSAPIPETELPAGVYLDGGATPEPPDWLIKGLLPKRGVCCLGGQSGAGKTFIAVELAVRLASGQPFFGRRTRERIGVLILVGEGMATLPDRILAAKYGTQEAPLPIAYASITKAVKDNHDADAIVKIIGRVRDYLMAAFDVRLGLVIFDTLTAIFDVDDENDNAKAARCLRIMQRIERQLGTAILVVHHYGKTAETGLRGASAWRAGFDNVLAVIGTRNELTGAASNRKLVLAKSRLVEEGLISGFDLEPVALGEDADGEPYNSCRVMPTISADTTPRTRVSDGEKLLQRILTDASLLQERAIQGSTLWVVECEAARAKFMTSSVYDGDDGRRDATLRKRFSRALKAAAASGSIQEGREGENRYLWCIPNMPPPSVLFGPSSGDTGDTP